jgi:predicted ATPase
VVFGERCWALASVWSERVLKQVKLQKFRSILDATVHLSESGLTVLVGANGSGKTNIVKALDFISAMSRHGLKSAVLGQGGREGVLSKAVAAHDARGAATVLEYVCLLPPPDGYPPTLSPPAVSHRIEIEWQGLSRFRVRKEEVTFHEALCVGRYLRLLKDGAGKRATDQFSGLAAYQKDASSVVFVKEGRSGMRAEFRPEPTGDEVTDLMHWLGLLMAEGGRPTLTVEELRDFIQTSYPVSPSRKKGQRVANAVSFVDPEPAYLFQLAPQLGVFRRLMKDTKRYDLQLSELRREQQGSVSSDIGADGSNLPAAYRNLSQRGRTGREGRMMDTLRAIAPQVLRGKARTLRTGKELVEFIESETGRPVESWHSADGTLRALAILVAVETHPEDGTVVIEEPERCLHPWAVRSLIEHMRHVIEERSVQVVLTTHSEQVLECLKPDELLVLERDGDSGTKVRRLEEIVPAHTMSMGDIGRQWVQGTLGGVPTYDD